MKEKLRQGFGQGIGLFLGLCASALFAYEVTGTIKTWTTGDTLTATDLNTTVQSLKTAVESASQVGAVRVYSGAGGASNYSGFLSYPTGTSQSESQVQWPATRAGTVKNVRLINNNSASTCGVGPTVFTLRKNGADTTISMSVPQGSSAQVTSANTVSFVAGDLLSWRGSCGNAGSVDVTIYFEF